MKVDNPRVFVWALTKVDNRIKNIKYLIALNSPLFNVESYCTNILFIDLTDCQNLACCGVEIVSLVK